MREVPTVEQCVREDAIETQDIRELGLGWAWFVNDLRAFLPAWQDMEWHLLILKSQYVPVNRSPCKQRMLIWNMICSLMSGHSPFLLLEPQNRSLIGTTHVPWTLKTRPRLV